MEKSTYIIAGGGCSGLSLACELAERSHTSSQITIIDRERKRSNDRTWCFWAEDAIFPSSLIHHSWPNMSFAASGSLHIESISPFNYYMIRSADWYAHMWRRLSAYPNVRFVPGNIERIDEDQESPYVVVDGQIIRGDWVLNSVVPAREKESRYPVFRLWQHFAGWWVRTDEPVFDATDARLMDFRTAQHGDTRFVYVLPFSDREALVEYTIFSKDLLKAGDYEKGLRTYLNDFFPNVGYQIEEREGGKIPMTNASFERYRSDHVINVGTVGGAVKPTTGYAFLRIQQESKYIAQQLLAGKRVADVHSSAARFAFYDRLLLHILSNRGEKGASIFAALFRSNPMSRILTFLNEDSNLLQEALIFSRLPYAPFLQALGKECWMAGFKKPAPVSTSSSVWHPTDNPLTTEQSPTI